jgi:hypothetical protein
MATKPPNPEVGVALVKPGGQITSPWWQWINEWWRWYRYTTTTAKRPVLTKNDVGFPAFDTTINAPIWWDGNVWIEISGGGGGGGVTSVSGSPPIVSTGGANPTLSMPPATASVNGYLKATDWVTFNGKEPPIAAGTTSQWWRGDKSWQTLPATSWGSITGVPATFPPSAHTHVAANVTDFSEAVDDRVGSLLTAGSNVTLLYNDVSNTLTIDSIPLASIRTNVKDFGAKGDGVYVTGMATIAAGSNALQLIGANFQTADIGKRIVLPGAGTAGVPLSTTIAGRTSSSQITLGTTAITALASVSSRVFYGTDDRTAFVNALASLPLTGGIVDVPQGIYGIGSPLSMGNGTASSSSASYGFRLLGETPPIFGAFNSDNYYGGYYPETMGTALAWCGAYSTTDWLLGVAGPLRGFEVSNLMFDGNELAAIGLNLYAASYGTIDNLSFRGFLGKGLYTAAPSVTTFGSDGNTSHITSKGLYFHLPNVGAPVGMYLDGPVDVTCDTHSLVFDLVRVHLSQSVTCYGAVFKCCDTVTINNLLMVVNPGVSGPGSANPSAIGVLYDYNYPTGVGAVPADIVLHQVDVALGVSAARQFMAVNVPPSFAAMNVHNNIIGYLGETNGGAYPTVLPNTLIDLPMKQACDVALTAQAAAIAATTILTAIKPGMWRINYSIEITQAGTAGTIQLQIGWTSPAGGRGANVGPALAVTGLGGHNEGSLPVYSAAGPIQYVVVFAGVTGAVRYALYLTAEKLS